MSHGRICSCSTLIDALGLEETGLNLAPSINECAGKERTSARIFVYSGQTWKMGQRNRRNESCSLVLESPLCQFVSLFKKN